MIKKIKNEFNSQPISFLGAIIAIVTGIITIANIYISVPALFSNLTPPHISTKIEINLILGLCIFSLLEGSLASFFGFLFVRIKEKGSGFPFMLLFLTSLISAWISGFNCFWIFVPLLHSPASAVWVFLLMLTIAWGIAIYFIRYHFNVRIKKSTNSSHAKHIIANPIENNLQKISTEDSVTELEQGPMPEEGSMSEEEPNVSNTNNFWICFVIQTAGFIFIATYYGIKIFDLMQASSMGTN